MDGYKPHQLSTFALTLFRHNFADDEGNTIPVGASRCVVGQALSLSVTREAHPTRSPYVVGGGFQYPHAQQEWGCGWVCRHLGHRRAGEVPEPPPVLLLQGACVYHGAACGTLDAVYIQCSFVCGSTLRREAGWAWRPYEGSG
jgi:hypothetical protein